MKKAVRAAAAGVLFAGVATAGAFAATDTAQAQACGWYKNNGAVYYIVSGYNVYTITNVHVHYKNCSGKTKRVRVDISFAPDLACKTVANNATTSWVYSDNSRDFSSVRNVVDC